MQNKTLILFLLTLIICSSCIDQIPIDIKENKNEFLIVNAELRDNETNHSISIKINNQETNDFQADFPVNDAEVFITSDRRYDFINFADKGIYKNADLVLKPNSTYVLNIIFNGVLYQSKSETLKESIPIKDVYTVLTNEVRNNSSGNIINSDLVNVYVNAQLPTDEEVYLKYGVKGTYEYREIGTQANLNPVFCFVDEIIDLDNIAIASNDEVSEGKVENKLVLQKIADYRFAVRYCMKVYQERVTKNAYTFWKKVENEYTRTGDIFEKPPGIIRGNISEQEETDVSVIGLFSVAAVDSFKLLLQPEAAGSPTPQCRPFPRPPATCENCLLIPKSTLVKPECFF